MEGEVKYWIDGNDVITEVNREWFTFAAENDAKDAFVVGQSIWKFISGRDTKYLFTLILQKARKTSRIFHFPIRCDSPTIRRFMDMTVRQAAPGRLEVSFRTTRTEPIHRPSSVSSPVKASPKGIVPMCSWCNRIKTAKDTWDEIEEAAQVLGLLEKLPAPSFSHTICDDCFARVMKELDSSPNGEADTLDPGIRPRL